MQSEPMQRGSEFLIALKCHVSHTHICGAPHTHTCDFNPTIRIGIGIGNRIGIGIGIGNRIGTGIGTGIGTI